MLGGKYTPEMGSITYCGERQPIVRMDLPIF